MYLPPSHVAFASAYHLSHFLAENVKDDIGGRQSNAKIVLTAVGSCANQTTINDCSIVTFQTLTSTTPYLRCRKCPTHFFSPPNRSTRVTLVNN